MNSSLRYTILTTCPDYGSRNVGDKLIEQRTKDLIQRERGPCKFETIFREEPLEERLDDINESQAILMPAFPIRDTPMYPGTYRLVEDLSRIRVPMIPIGANWNVYPGDEVSRSTVQYSEATVRFLRHIASQVECVSCREHNVRRILRRHGIENTVYTGDPAMFNTRFLGKPMKRPTDIRKLVFSPPLSAYYVEQAEQVLETLAQLFPYAERYCAFHLDDADNSPDARRENSAAMRPEVAEKNRRIRERATALGYADWHFGGNIDGLRAYEDCDLHVGYECHAHLYFLSARLPSILIAE
ncbi:MAG: polysaccharide pyruvyl transferase family protein, partial [Candidatus Pacebacteria bacterium]|nr:polysaccharide pyruvyl transferase family protein [Candidatus Paceibacterota bacterium]